MSEDLRNNGLTPAQCAELTVKKIIEDSTIPYLSISPSDKKADIFKSKLGGLPYLPKNAVIPIDSNGRQISF